jgi:esterase
MILNSQIFGSGKKLIILHGMYGSSDSWTRIAKSFEHNYEVHLPDLRNHGDSFHHPVHSYYEMSEDLKRYMYHHKIPKAIICGHSMGGKTAMFFAANYPDLCEKLIIADISPRDYRELNEYSPRINFHLNLISLFKNLEPHNFSTYKDFAKHLPVKEEPFRSLILKNLRKTEGRLEWQLNVDAIFNNIDNIFEGLNPDDFIDKKINIPTLFIRGENSDYIDSNDEKLISFIFLNVKIQSISNAGHWLHIEQTDEVVRVLSNWLN